MQIYQLQKKKWFWFSLISLERWKQLCATVLLASCSFYGGSAYRSGSSSISHNAWIEHIIWWMWMYSSTHSSVISKTMLWHEHTGWDDRQPIILDGNQEAKVRKNGEIICQGSVMESDAPGMSAPGSSHNWIASRLFKKGIRHSLGRDWPSIS